MSMSILLLFDYFIVCVRSSSLTIAESLRTTEDGGSRNGSAAEDDEEVDESGNWDSDEVRTSRIDCSLCLLSMLWL